VLSGAELWPFKAEWIPSPLRPQPLLQALSHHTMKLSFAVLLASVAAASVLEKRATSCAADNCLRALTGTGSNTMTARPVIAKADCSSFLSTVVTTTITPADL
jgi:hypothetical protein